VAALIGSQRDDHRIPATVACRALGMSRSWYYKWRGGALPPGAERRRRLAAEIKRLFELHEGKYGSARITDDLRDGGWRVSENTVAALMREQGLAARRKEKRRSTTRPARAGGGRRSWSSGTSPRPRSIRSGLVTGPRYPSVRASSTSPRSWTWAPAECWGSRYRSTTTRSSLTARWPWRWRCAAARCPASSCTPTRAAREYTAGAFRAACGRRSITQSMGRPGSALDNAVIESWHSTLEFELRRLEHFATKAAARAKVAAWIEDYNTTRKHSALGMRSPLAYDQALTAGKAA
jgi:putative transposase